MAGAAVVVVFAVGNGAVGDPCRVCPGGTELLPGTEANAECTAVLPGIGRGPGIGLEFQNFGKHGVGAVGATGTCPEGNARLSPSRGFRDHHRLRHPALPGPALPFPAGRRPLAAAGQHSEPRAPPRRSRHRRRSHTADGAVRARSAWRKGR